MGQARRYLLNCDFEQTSGVTTITGVTTYNLLNEFSGTSVFDSGTTFSYSNITIGELKDLNEYNYDQRVINFLSYVSQFESSYSLSSILSLGINAQFEELFCEET